MNYEIKDFEYKGFNFYSVDVKLPKTNLLCVGNDKGYFMCGALDVPLFDSKPHLKERKVIAGRCMGVKTIEELMNGELFEITEEAANLGIFKGMLVKDALLILAK